MLSIIIFLIAVNEKQTVQLITPAEADYVTSPHAVLDFANYLYETEDYQSAAIEYERAVFLGVSSEQIILQLGRTYLHLNEPNLAYKYLTQLSSDTSFVLIGLSYVESSKSDSAKYFFSCIKDGNLQNRLTTGYSELLKIDYKKPLLAGVLSSVLPGSGRLYAGRGKDGIFSFMFTVGSFALSCYYYESSEKENVPLQTIIFGSAGILFYLGDIYGSVESAKFYNKNLFNEKFSKFKSNFSNFF